MAIKVLIADDHGVLRAGLRALLNHEHDLEVIGEAADGCTALQLARQLSPDIVLLDLSMPGPEGGTIEVIRQLKQALPEVRVLILTLHEDVAMLREAIHAGASGYTVKRAVDVELIAAIHAVQRGELYVHPTMTQALLEELAPAPPQKKSIEVTLTRRELEVLRLVVKGYTNRRVAEELVISIGTVNSHLANLMSKLDLHNRVELVRYAAKHGLLE